MQGAARVKMTAEPGRGLDLQPAGAGLLAPGEFLAAALDEGGEAPQHFNIEPLQRNGRKALLGQGLDQRGFAKDAGGRDAGARQEKRQRPPRAGAAAGGAEATKSPTAHREAETAKAHRG